MADAMSSVTQPHSVELVADVEVVVETAAVAVGITSVADIAAAVVACDNGLVVDVVKHSVAVVIVAAADSVGRSCMDCMHQSTIELVLEQSGQRLLDYQPVVMLNAKSMAMLLQSVQYLGHYYSIGDHCLG